jgi:hypothetical protein
MSAVPLIATKSRTSHYVTSRYPVGVSADCDPRFIGIEACRPLD